MDCRVKPGNDRAKLVRPLRVPDAVQRKRKARSDAPLIRDRHGLERSGLERSRVCSAPFVSLMLRCARDTQIETAALLFLAVLRHADAVRVDVGECGPWAGFGGEICWCRRADSNRQPIAYEAIALPLSYCGVQRGPSTKLLSKKPPLVEEAQSAVAYRSELTHFFFDGCPGQARA